MITLLLVGLSKQLNRVMRLLNIILEECIFLERVDDKNFLEARFWIKQALENNDEYIGALAQQVWDDYKLGTY